MKGKIYSLLGVFALSLVLLAGNAFAQQQEDLITNESMGLEETESTPANGSFAVPEEALVKPMEGVTILAEVEIFNPKIVSQDGNKFNLEFDVFNARNVQPQIMYSVQLTQPFKYPDGVMRNRMVYEKVYSDTFSLGEREMVHKEIEFVAPDILNGKFNLFINSQNESGMPFALSDLGEISLDGSTDNHLIIDDLSCYMGVEGDNDKYPAQFGVDISADEKLTLNCSVKNGFSEEMEFYPSFTVFERSRFGKTVSSQVSSEKYVLEAGESKEVSFPIEKMEKAQAYEGVLVLVDANNKVLSGETVFRYVIHGNSASIQNLRLDKDYYSEGDVAKASFYVTGSADAFFGARNVNEDAKSIIIEVLVKDSRGNMCSDKVSKSLSSDTREVNLDINITSECRNPQIGAVAKDENGNILHENSFAITTKKEAERAVVEKKEAGNLAKTLALVFSAIFIIALFFVGFKKKRGMKIFILMLFAGALLLISDKEAKAVTFNFESGHCGVYMTVGHNKWWYNPGETIASTASPIRFECCNNVYESWATLRWGMDGGAKTVLTSGYQIRSGALGLHDSNISYDGGGTAYRAAPSAAGSHYANYWLNFTNSFGETVNSYADIWVGVKAGPTAYIDIPTATPSAVNYGSNIHFKGRGVLGYGGTAIDLAGWVDARENTPSWNGTTCVASDGTPLSNSLDFYKNDLSVGIHRICLSVRQSNVDGTYSWNKAANTDHITLNILNCNPQTYTCKVTSGDPTFCNNPSNCELVHSVFRDCEVVDSCGNTTRQNAAVCAANGVPCQEEFIESCPACDIPCEPVSYVCNIVDGDPNYCADDANCEKNHTVTRNCSVTDSCGNTTTQSASVCSANSVPCEGKTEETCGDCPDTTNWIEVTP